MRAYLVTSGTIFGLLVVAHVMRVIVEGSAVARDPIFVVTTIIAVGLCFWAFRLLRLAPRS